MTYLDMSNIGELEKEYVMKALDSGYVSTAGPLVEEFEKAMADYLGVEDALATNSGTSALHLALIGCGVGPGDEVVVPALTFIATANAVSYTGAKPVFVDVDERTWTISPEKIKEAITDKTKAIIPVHLYGNPCQMDEILKLSYDYNLTIIEDACESLGAKYKCKNTGTIGDYGCFSFNGNKTMTTGGGGLLITKDKDNLEHLKWLSTQAKILDRYHNKIGYNYRITNIAASIGLAQMKRLHIFLIHQRICREIYYDQLKKLVSFQLPLSGCESSNWFTAIRMNPCKKDLKFDYRRVFYPIPCQEAYRHLNVSDRSIKNSINISDNGYCLPRSTLNSIEDIYKICENIRKAIEHPSVWTT